MSELSERVQRFSKVYVARATVFFFGAFLMIPLMESQLAKLGAAVERSDREELAAEAVFSPALTPIARAPMREELPTYRPHGELGPRVGETYLGGPLIVPPARPGPEEPAPSWVKTPLCHHEGRKKP